MTSQSKLFVRVDDRLIHGQVVTTWVRSLGVSTIWVMSDRAANEPIEIILLKSSVPSHLKLEVFTVLQTAQALERHSGGTVLLLAEYLQDVVRLHAMGVPLDEINLGGMRYRPGYVSLSRAIYVGDREVDSLRTLQEQGIPSWIRVVPSDAKTDAYERLEQRWK